MHCMIWLASVHVDYIITKIHRRQKVHACHSCNNNYFIHTAWKVSLDVELKSLVSDATNFDSWLKLQCIRIWGTGHTGNTQPLEMQCSYGEEVLWQVSLKYTEQTFSSQRLWDMPIRKTVPTCTCHRAVHALQVSITSALLYVPQKWPLCIAGLCSLTGLWLDLWPWGVWGSIHGPFYWMAACMYPVPGTADVLRDNCHLGDLKPTSMDLHATHPDYTLASQMCWGKCGMSCYSCLGRDVNDFYNRLKPAIP